jgi:GMP synthase-like glutamine amidotransferase
MDVKLKLEAISGQPCIVLRYTDVTAQLLRDLNITSLVVSGNAVGFEEYSDGSLAELQQIICQADLPIIGLCGGHQLIGIAHGAPTQPMRPLQPDEPDPTTLSAPGYYKEWGYFPVNVLQPDPLFDGLGPAPTFLEAHFCELKELPVGFERLASTAECPIQAMKRVGRLVYGVQFHPEAYTEGTHDRRNSLVDLIYPDGSAPDRPDGQRLLANFFRIASARQRHPLIGVE